jgi:hypothetical protein
MPLLDDETLGVLLHDLGDSFPVPPSGVSDTLRRVYRVDDEKPASSRTDDEVGPTTEARPRRIGTMIRSHRVLSVAACIAVLLLALGGGAAVLGNRTPAPRETAAGAAHGPRSTTRHAASSGGSTTFGGSATAGKTAGTTKNFSANRRLSKTVNGALGAPSPSTAGAGSAASTGSTGAVPAGAVGQPAKIQQTGSLELTVPQGALAKSMAKLSSLATTYGGFVANSQTQSGSATDPPSGTVTLQVPVANFGAVLKATEALGKASSVTRPPTSPVSTWICSRGSRRCRPVASST